MGSHYSLLACLHDIPELDTDISSFREILQNSWIKRAIRILTSSYRSLPHEDEISKLRDKEWEQKEASFHEQAVTELNQLIRKYNGLAPYATRRSYLSRINHLSEQQYM